MNAGGSSVRICRMSNRSDGLRADGGLSVGAPETAGGVDGLADELFGGSGVAPLEMDIGPLPRELGVSAGGGIFTLSSTTLTG